MLKVPDVIVDCAWLKEHLRYDELIVLDATIPKVTVKPSEQPKGNNSIPNARFFDIKKIFSDQNASFPNTMLSAEDFQEKAQVLGISQDSCVVVYDDHGVYSSPRAWWMFRSMGFENIAVLNGGLPEWKRLGFEVSERSDTNHERGNFQSHKKEELFVDYDYVLGAIESREFRLLDARSKGRFIGESPEPREGVKSGHIPTAKSLPYSSLLDGHTLKAKENLRVLYQEVNKENQPMIFSCGTGITACVLALGAEIAGYQSNLVYDGSWTEWGSLPDLPIEV